MGTTFEVKVIAHMDPNAEELLWQTVNMAMESVDGSMSTYKSDSELSRLNDYADPEPLEISPDLMMVLQAAVELHMTSGGAFDPTVGPLVDRWGFGPQQNQSPPSDTEIQSLLGSIGADKLVLDEATSTVLKQSGSVRVDLSAIAKGLAVDRVGEGIESLGYTSWYVEIGGEIRTSGNNAEGIPWQLAIESPAVNVGERLEMLRLPMVDMALATSGDYRNQREVDGKIVSHTLDPRTGYPIDHGLASVSVLASSCMWADGWATALNVLGLQEGLALAESEGVRALFVQRAEDGSLVQSSTRAWDAYMAEHAPESDEVGEPG
jgi:thiamine biosynthesis lipoprotein